jgi:hypothetical protein
MKPTFLMSFTLALVALMLLGGRTPGAIVGRGQSVVPDVGPGVFHVKARHVWTTPQGEQKGVRENEFWYDPNTQDARYDQKSLTSDYHTIMRRNGRTYSTQYPRINMVSDETYTDETAPILRSVQDKVLFYKAALDRGELRGIGEEVVDGKLAIVVWQQADLEGIDVLRVSVDSVSGLPLKEIAYRNSLLGGVEEVEKQFITYTLVEHVDRSNLPADLFSAPDAVHRVNQVYMTPTSAGNFAEFGIYWLGTSFNALPLATIDHTEYVNVDAPGRISAVSASYAAPSIAPVGLHIRQQPSTGVTDEARECGESPGSSGVAERVAVGDRQVVLCDFEGEGVQANLMIDGTFITLSGRHRQEVLQAVESLRKLN